MWSAHLCPDLASHFFCHVLGAWPHHVRSPGVPATRGLTDHPHPQHPHLPPPYLSHPAFYSPIPHPSMLYPYMAPHPYPPPAASLPESPSRKRSGPEETQNSRSKRKRLNARDAVEGEQFTLFIIGTCTWPHVISHDSKWVAARLYREQAKPSCADCRAKRYGLPWVWGRQVLILELLSFRFCISPTTSLHTWIRSKYER